MQGIDDACAAAQPSAGITTQGKDKRRFLSGMTTKNTQTEIFISDQKC